MVKVLGEITDNPRMPPAPTIKAILPCLGLLCLLACDPLWPQEESARETGTAEELKEQQNEEFEALVGDGQG